MTKAWFHTSEGIMKGANGLSGGTMRHQPFQEQLACLEQWIVSEDTPWGGISRQRALLHVFVESSILVVTIGIQAVYDRRHLCPRKFPDVGVFVCQLVSELIEHANAADGLSPITGLRRRQGVLKIKVY